MSKTNPTADSIAERRPLGCYDCGFSYGGIGWVDVLVPNDVWAQISPTHDEGGVLCFNCIARRAERLGLTDVAVLLLSGPLRQKDAEQADQDGFRRGWDVGRQEMREGR